MRQLIGTLQDEAPQVRTAAAAQAKQSVTEAQVFGGRSEAVVDTRSLEAPRNSDDQSKFVFLGYTGTDGARLKSATSESVTMQKSALTDSMVLLLEGSAQRLCLLEHAGDGEGLLDRHWSVSEDDLTAVEMDTSLLPELLTRAFRRNTRGLMDEFETKIQRCERSCNEVLTDRVRFEVIQMSPS